MLDRVTRDYKDNVTFVSFVITNWLDQMDIAALIDKSTVSDFSETKEKLQDPTSNLLRFLDAGFYTLDKRLAELREKLRVRKTLSHEKKTYFFDVNWCRRSINHHVISIPFIDEVGSRTVFGKLEMNL